MVRYLNRNFINVWVLLTDMKLLLKKHPNTPEGRFARAVLASYSFPVVIATVSPQGDKVWASFNLNDLLSRTQRRQGLSYGMMWLLLAMNQYPPYDAQMRSRFVREQMDRFSYNMDRMEWEYLYFLWKAAHQHGQGHLIMKPPATGWKPRLKRPAPRRKGEVRSHRKAWVRLAPTSRRVVAPNVEPPALESSGAHNTR